MLDVAGLVVEQHPDRARLFMQWKQMAWPVVWDPFNLLELPVVPVTLLIDPSGQVRLIQPLLERIGDIEGLIREGHQSGEEPAAEPPAVAPAISRPEADASGSAWSDYAIELVLWRGAEVLDEAIDAGTRAVAGSSAAGSDWFRLGVLHRMRYDSDLRRPGDFAAAVANWGAALDRDPNNYIWRRRLQQYGPRLAKPYPFYDWVDDARSEIEERGEQPVHLVVEPTGAELTQPADPVSAQAVAAQAPDPDGLIHRDVEGLLDVEVVLVPPVARPGESVRAHLVMTPSSELDAHWNNEAGPGRVYFEGPPGIIIHPGAQDLEVESETVSDKARHVEFEVQISEDHAPGLAKLNGYLLYYVCEGVTGVCMYRRKDLNLDLAIRERDGATLARPA